MDALVIRRATVADAERLAAAAAAMFHASYAAQNTPEDMAAYLASAFTVERTRTELADPRVTALVAELHDGAVAAYAIVARHDDAPACVTGAAPVELRRFYVAHALHGAGLAQRLMAATLDAARALGGATLWCTVWQRNPRALRFYGREGFVAVGTAVFTLGADLQDDWVLVRPLDV
jgi:GNAT superfamily N-acetyltransferase